MQLFYCPDLSPEEVTLSKEDSKHAVKVLRKQEGDTIHLIDGKGTAAKGEVVISDHKRCSIRIVEREENYQKRKYHLHVAIAPTKNTGRIDWFLEKATEIGIDEVSPILCEQSERKQVRTDRLDKIAVGAMKQSLKAYLPIVNEMISMKELVNQSTADQKFIAHCNDNANDHLKDLCKPNHSIIILIGPEGDFSQKEIDFAIENGFKPITLGESRLRTETAGIMATSIINIINS